MTLAPGAGYWVETLGCPKNQVDSDKLVGRLVAGGLVEAAEPGGADVVVVNTCAFIEEARQESIDTILALADARGPGARLVVTGCLAERYGDELVDLLPEADVIAPFGTAFDGLSFEGLSPEGLSPEGLSLEGSTPTAAARHERPGTAAEHDERPAPAAVPVVIGGRAPDFDLLRLPRPPASAPWAYVKIAEGCDRACGFCAIPSFRGPQRSRSIDDVVAEVDALDAREIVLVAQDLASFGRDQGHGEKRLVELIGAVGARVERVRCLYLYPSELNDGLVDAICATGVPYFDLSLQHVSAPLLRRMRRWGDGERFLARIRAIRSRESEAAFRSNFIVGYPGETEEDHDRLLEFVAEADLDWCGFFAYSREDGTHAADLDGTVERPLVDVRLAELRDLQDAITVRKRDEMIGARVEVLVDEPGRARSHREAPEIDGVVVVPDELPVGRFVKVEITGALGPDLIAVRA